METKIQVRDIMTREVVSIDINQSIPEAADRMIKNDVGSVIVTEKDRPVGIITERDFVKKITAMNLKPSNLKIKEVMTAPLITISVNEFVTEAMQQMLKMRIRRLPIVEGGRLVGIVTDTDLIAISIQMGEIFSDLIEMHRERVPPPPPSFTQGICENCGSFSEDLVSVEGTLMCESCREI